MPINQRALSLLEIVISLSLIAISVLGFAQVFQAGSMSIYKNDQENIATNLAVGLMSEIISKPFCDPTACTTTIGPEGETRASCTNNAFDEVDDYNGTTEGPDPAPRDVRGCEMAEFKGFRRWANVTYINETTMADSGTATNYKKVTVTVSSLGLPLVSFTEVKANITQ